MPVFQPARGIGRLLDIRFAGFASAVLLVCRAGAVDPAAEAAKLLEELPNLAEKAQRAKTERPPMSVAAAEARLKAASAKSERWNKLVKQGVISRAEADTAIMDRALAALGLERAKLAEARIQLAFAEGAAGDRVGQTVSLGDAATAVSDAEARVLAAQRELDRVRLEITRASLERFRKLYAERLVTKAQLQRLESTVAELEKAAEANRAGTAGEIKVPPNAPPAAAGGPPPPPLPVR